MGMCLHVPIYEVASWTDALSTLSTVTPHKVEDYNIFLADSREESIPYYQNNYISPTVVVIGSESAGISSEGRKLVQSHLSAKYVSIPTMRSLESLNAAIAGSIILSEANRQRFSINS